MSALPIILASASPRRRELLDSIGVAHEVRPCALVEPERAPPRLAPRAWAMSLAFYKARHVSDSTPHRTVLGADTIVVVGGRILGKPRDIDDARRMLEAQAGCWAEVVTGVALVRSDMSGLERRLIGVVTRVLMRDDSAERERYLATNDWQGKAGAYGIQDVGDRLVERFEGSFSNVVGLPTERLMPLLAGWM